ncbi:hypothetical protein [Pseudoalteromonas piscicida]|uniref:hypothetical protein n=1 Tax=Pseudoalteromonas piscicida TaxID=43662 RepID=UPI003C7A0147
MIDYEKVGQELLTKGQHQKYVELVKKATNELSDENTLAKLVGLIFENDIVEGFWLIEDFVNKHPNSLHIIRVYLSDLWARQGKFDEAANEARIYLWMLNETGLLTSNLDNPILLEGIARSLLLLTSVYTEAGARSYSIRVLQRGFSLRLAQHWKEHFKKEQRKLESELKEASCNKSDLDWEQFFGTGNCFVNIEKICEIKRFNYLQKRVELISNNFKFNSSYKVDEREQLMLVRRTESNEFYLS